MRSFVVVGRTKEPLPDVQEEASAKADSSSEEEVKEKAKKARKGKKSTPDKKPASKSKSKTPKNVSKGDVTVHLTQGTVVVEGVGVSWWSFVSLSGVT